MKISGAETSIIGKRLEKSATEIEREAITTIAEIVNHIAISAVLAIALSPLYEKNAVKRKIGANIHRAGEVSYNATSIKFRCSIIGRYDFRMKNAKNINAKIFLATFPRLYSTI